MSTHLRARVRLMKRRRRHGWEGIGTVVHAAFGPFRMSKPYPREKPQMRQSSVACSS